MNRRKFLSCALVPFVPVPAVAKAAQYKLYERTYAVERKITCPVIGVTRYFENGKIVFSTGGWLTPNEERSIYGAITSPTDRWRFKDWQTLCILRES